MKLEDAPREISQIFLSATAQDCKRFREAIRGVLEANISAAKIHLQEDWSEGGQFVVDVCQQRVADAHGYIGLFGHRYGWRPPGHSKSITELEFAWATERWPMREPPIFILRAEPGSEADAELEAAARPLLERDFADNADRSADRQRQAEFLARVDRWAAEGRILVLYRDMSQLLAKALSCVQNWNLDLLRRALDMRRGASVEIPASELGRIGRTEQRRALQAALERLERSERDVAAAFVIHGRENHGQRHFGEFVAADEMFGDAQVHVGQPADPDSIDALILWACGVLREPSEAAPDIAWLANALKSRLACESVLFVVRSLGRRAGRLEAFHKELLAPLRAALGPRTSSMRGQVFWVLVEHEQLDTQASWQSCGDPHAEPIDFERLVPLPELGNIDEHHVRAWLRELGSSGLVLKEARRHAIAERSTQDDGLPANVYERLVREGFWAA